LGPGDCMKDTSDRGFVPAQGPAPDHAARTLPLRCASIFGDFELAHVRPVVSSARTAALLTIAGPSASCRGLRMQPEFQKEFWVKVYESANIRNLALVGHSHAGKTSLIAAMLYTAGATQRLGRVDDGSTITDFDEEEVARHMSIATAMGIAEYGKSKLNLLDTPGFNMFVHEARLALPAVEAAAVVVDGVSGVEVMTERVWDYADEFELPRIIIATRMDRERADATRVLDSLTSAFGRGVVPVQLTIGSEKNLSGVVDLVRLKAYSYELGGNGKGKEIEIP